MARGAASLLPALVATLAIIGAGRAFLQPCGQARVAERRGFLAAVATALVAAPAAEDAFAEGKMPMAMQVNGMSGSYGDLNGRWGIVFGKMLNEKAVYKKDGVDGAYLLLNNCGTFQMTKKIDGSCNGFAVKDKEGWKVDGKADSEMKMRPWDVKNVADQSDFRV